MTTISRPKQLNVRPRICSKRQPQPRHLRHRLPPARNRLRAETDEAIKQFEIERKSVRPPQNGEVRLSSMIHWKTGSIR